MITVLGKNVKKSDDYEKIVKLWNAYKKAHKWWVDNGCKEKFKKDLRVRYEEVGCLLYKRLNDKFLSFSPR